MNFRHFLFFCCILLLSGSVNGQKWAQAYEEGRSYLAVKKAFDSEWNGKPYERSRGYKQFKRFENFHEPRLYPDYKWPNPMQVWNEMQKVVKDKQSNKMPSSSTWIPMGPTEWTDGAGWNAGLGRINVIMVDPNNASTIYVGAPAGGLWKSTNNGTSWTCLTDNQAVLGVSDMAIDPSNSNTIYIATGDGDASDTYSVGVLKSTNGGTSWSTTGLNFQVTQTRRIRRLIMHPTNSSILLAATTNGLYKTTNGGTSWTLVSGGSYQDLAYKPNNPNVVYAVNDEFFKSTNGGNSFTQISTGLPADNTVNRYKIGVSADEPNWVYLVCGKESNSTYKGLYRSTNSGTSFSLQSNSPNIFGYATDGSDSSGQSWYDLAIVVDPTDASTLWVGGVNVWKSTNAGVNYTCQTDWVYPNNIGYTHADIHYLNIYNGNVYCGSDGGVFSSSNGGSSWSDLSSGLQISQFYKLSTSQTNNNIVITGSQDNGTNRYNGSTNWTHVIGADGMECIIDPTNPNRMYGAIQYGSIRRSTNGGNSFSSIIKPDDFNDTGAWVSPYVLDPNNTNTIYVGYTELYKSTNGGNSFTQVSNRNTSKTLRVIDVCASNSSVIYVSDRDDIYRSSNGGSSFTNISSNLPNKRVTDIVTDPLDENRVWVTLSGYTNNAKVYFSSNGGTSWTNMSTGLPNLPVNCMVRRDGSNDELYVGTDVGVYTLSGNSGSWTLFGGGLPNVIVNELEITYTSSMLRAATYGRGLWEAALGSNCTSDVIDPVINCPTTIPSPYTSSPVDCSFDVTLPVATATDNCTANPLMEWRFIETNSSQTPLPGAVFSSYSTLADFTFDVGYYTVEWRATDDAGNDADCSYWIEIEDDTAPVVNCFDNLTFSLNSSGNLALTSAELADGISDNCGIASIDLFNETFTCSDLGPSTVVLVINDPSSNTSTCNVNVNVVDNVNPVANCIPSITVGLTNGVAVIGLDQVDAGSTDNCAVSSRFLDITTFNCNDIGVVPVTMTVFDASGNNSDCVTNVTVESFTPVIAECQDIPVFLNDLGTVTVAAQAVDAGSSTDCGILTFSLDQSTFNCDDLGPNTVTLTVENGLGDLATCTAVITVNDEFTPFMQCMDDLVYALDTAGQVSINPSDLDNGSNENCSLNLSLVPNSFDCDDLGTQIVTLIGTDGSGNTGSCSTTITIEDNISPVAECVGTVNITLDANGEYTLSTDEVDDGSTDNCDFISSSLSNSAFNCDDIGSQVVTLFVVDVDGNSDDCTSTIVVADGSQPQMECQNITVALDASGSAVINTADVDDGSSLPCGTLNLALDLTTFDCDDIGQTIVVLTGTADSGASDACSSTVTIVDNLSPSLTCLGSVDVVLDAGGMASIDPQFFIISSSDNCDTPSITADIASVTCADIGSVDLNITAEDASGNSNTCPVSINVIDETAPVLVCSDAEVTIDGQGLEVLASSVFVDSVTDNCDNNLVVSPADIEIDCNSEGQTNLTLTVNDASGNTSDCSVTLTVLVDATPVANCVSSFTVELDGSGMGTLVPANIDNGSSLACTNPVLTVSQTSFDCADLGPLDIVLTASNGGGNSATCTTTINVVDNIDPLIDCGSLTTTLNSSGEVTVLAEDLVNTVSDNCELGNYTTNSFDFTCDDQGVNGVIIEISDNSGNTNSCEAFIEVLDEVMPVAVCLDLEIELNADGEAVVSPELIAGASTDLCGDVELDTDQSFFDCSDIGSIQTINVIVEDQSGNIATCQSEITLVDVLAPVALCQNADVFISTGNMAVVEAASIDDGSTDNCAILDMTVSPSMFSCDDLGTQQVTLTVSDAAGNEANCTADINVVDNSNPEAECYNNVDVDLGDDGNLELELEMIYSGNGLSCSPIEYTISPSTFDCTDIDSPTAVTLTFEPDGGTVTNCIAVVNVLDVTPPDVVCSDLDTVLLSGTELVIYPGLLGGLSTDICSDTVYYTVDSLVLTCDDLGTFVEDMIIVDNWGNFDTCQSTITLANMSEPIAFCKDAVLYLDENGDASLTAQDIDNGSSDACGDVPSVTFTLGETLFDCEDVGPQIVTLTVTDLNTGIATGCEAIVSVFDTIPPTPIYQDTIDLVLNANMDVSQLTGALYDIDMNSFDECCPALNYLLRRPDEVCDNTFEFEFSVNFCIDEPAGIYPLTLRVLDCNGNFSDVPVWVNVVNPVSTETVDSKLRQIYCSPNPFYDEASLYLDLIEDENLSINIYSMDGKRIWDKQTYLNKGLSSIPLDLGPISNGVYWVEVQGENWKKAIKIVKVK